MLASKNIFVAHIQILLKTFR